MTNFTTWIATIVIVSGVLTASEDVAHHLNNTEILLENDTKVLSRAKRYLTFPDGSSFQLVFCTQTHGYLQVGDIVWFGNTAALAWELPSDPQFFTFLKQHSKDFAQKRQDLSKHIYYLDDTGKVISKVTYKRKPIVNPAFAKRSVDNADFKSNMVTKAVRDKMHDVHKHKSYLQDLDKASIEFHKTSRKNLYEKLEIFLEAVGWRGRECVLRMLCEARGVYGRQGSFFEEILKATFTLPQGRGFDSAHDHYDTAHETGGDCAEMYPECRANHNVV